LLTGHPDASIEDGIAWIDETVTLLGISGLGCFGLRPEHADQVVAKAAVSSSMQGNPVPLAEADLHAILAAAM
jgi:alcohol dehydrogenase class IV